jgi:hypothetical protein
MLVYPQIAPGGMAQYPLERNRVQRCAAARTPGGVWFVRHDPEAGETRWELQYESLSGSEAERLGDFFEAAGGRLRSFVFVDPMANLLRWSGDLAHPVWERALAGLEPSGEPDPDGGQGCFRLTNPAGAPGGIAQTIPAPGGYEYVFSVWLKGTSGAAGRLKMGPTEVEVKFGGGWERFQVSGRLETETGLQSAVELPAGGECLVYGPQVEPQRRASGYQRSSGGSSIYANARFDMDELEWVIDGPQQYGTRVRIRSRQQD